MSSKGRGLISATASVPSLWLLSAATAVTALLAAPTLMATAPPKEWPTTTTRWRLRSAK
jgi:hypothetical protein